MLYELKELELLASKLIPLLDFFQGFSSVLGTQSLSYIVCNLSLSDSGFLMISVIQTKLLNNILDI